MEFLIFEEKAADFWSNRATTDRKVSFGASVRLCLFNLNIFQETNYSSNNS